jgi:hypothetical protein
MLYQTNEYRTRRRTWVAAGASLAAVVALLILIMAACQARDDRADELTNGIGVGGGSSTPTTTATADPEDPAQPAGGQGGQSGGGDSPAQQEEEETEDPEEPAPPLDIEVTIDTVAPGGQCFAAGTIAVSGGNYPVTVHYQWRRLVVAGGWDGEPVSAVQNHTFDEPGAINVQTNNLPESGTNVFLVVSSPKTAGSGLTGYDGCGDGAGGITSGS